jgi:hypothetical protein
MKIKTENENLNGRKRIRMNEKENEGSQRLGTENKRALSSSMI